MNKEDKVQPVDSLSELADIVVNTTEVFSYFYTSKQGRPPKLERAHIKSLLKLIKTLVDDIDTLMDNLLPDTTQVNNLLSTLDYLSSVKKRYRKRIYYMQQAGVTPDDIITYKDNNNEKS